MDHCSSFILMDAFNRKLKEEVPVVPLACLITGEIPVFSRPCNLIPVPPAADGHS